MMALWIALETCRDTTQLGVLPHSEGVVHAPASLDAWLVIMGHVGLSGPPRPLGVSSRKISSSHGDNKSDAHQYPFHASTIRPATSHRQGKHAGGFATC